jgi:hypothetical protein
LALIPVSLSLGQSVIQIFKTRLNASGAVFPFLSRNLAACRIQCGGLLALLKVRNEPPSNYKGAQQQAR